MQNDVLKNNIAPWQEKGRWYHGKVSSINGAIIRKETDQYLIDHLVYYENSNIFYVYLDDNHTILDCIYETSSLTPITAVIMPVKRANTSGIISYAVTPKGTAGTSEFWLFIK